MNVLFICDEYPPGLHGGIGSITQSLARAIASQGHKVCVLGLYENEYGAADFELDGLVKVWRLRYKMSWPHHELSYKIQRNLPSIIQKILPGYKAYRSYLDFVEQLVKKEHIDVIEMADWNTCIYKIGINLPFPKLPIPIVLKFNGSKTYFNQELHRPLRKKWFEIDKAIFDRADSLVAASRYTAEVNTQLYQSNRSISVLYNSIEIPSKTTNRPLENTFTAVFAGTLIEKKGIFSLMKAWNLVYAQEPRARLLIFGKGDTTPMKLLLQDNVLESVHFKGHQSKSTLLEHFSKAALAIFPSYTEAFSLAPLESMSMSCPTIFTIKSSGKEIIQEGETGFLVDPDNIEQIAQKILRLIQDKALQDQIGNAARDEVAVKFNIEGSAQDHIQFYQKAIAAFKSTIATHV